MSALPAPSARAGGWFVPHDIAEPIVGARTGTLGELTVVVKDAFDVAGSRTGGGSPEWLARQQPAARHAVAVAALLDAGATVVGKTVCDELFYSLSGQNAHYGTPLNPRAAGRVPGGSSSGSAAAVAAGACDIGLGTDTGGSIRVPAAFCGIYGLRPTHGRIDTGGVMAMAPSFDTVGWFAAGPGLLRRAGAVLLADDRSVRSTVTRLIVAEDAFAEADTGVAEVCRAFLEAAAASLPTPQCERLADEGLDAWREVFRVIQAWEAWRTYGPFVERVSPALGPGVAERIAAAARVEAEQVRDARAAAVRVRARLRRLIGPGTVVALPTAPGVAPTIESAVMSSDHFRSRCLRLTAIAGLGGLPQVSIPAGLLGGCPVGMSLIAWAGGDECLLALTAAIGSRAGLTHVEEGG